MTLSISFPIDTFVTSGDALQFIYPFIDQDITAITSNRSYKDGEDLEVTDAISQLRSNKDMSFILSNGNDEEKNSIIFRKDNQHSTETFWLTLEKTEPSQWTSLIQASAKKGMSMAFLFDHEKSKWQSEENISMYNYYKRPHEHLKKIVVIPNVAPIVGHRIDISQNPGHKKLTYGMSLMAAPEMWFGPGCWQYFDPTLVKTFPEAQKIEEWPEGVVNVRLFEPDTPDYEAPEILDLQKRFRTWVKMDDIELHLNSLVKKKPS
jgi:hypothetical protein